MAPSVAGGPSLPVVMPGNASCNAIDVPLQYSLAGWACSAVLAKETRVL
jgi:hypothetical protein